MTDPQDKNQQDASQTQDPNGQPAAQSQTSPTPQEFEAIKSELEQTQTKLSEMLIISQRALADLQNYRRRTEEEKASFVEFANADLILGLIPALNGIDMALKHEPKDEDWIKGIEASLRQITNEFLKRGLKEIPTTGQKFDPKLHEALLVAPGEKDTILEELEKGYMLGERVIKPARVKVGNGEMAK
jgi:molecular chaperone GrpE